jgi:hypothetical protein
MGRKGNAGDEMGGCEAHMGRKGNAGDEIGGCEAHMGRKGNAYTDRIWKPQRKRPLGRPRHT